MSFLNPWRWGGQQLWASGRKKGAVVVFIMELLSIPVVVFFLGLGLWLLFGGSLPKEEEKKPPKEQESRYKVEYKKESNIEWPEGARMDPLQSVLGDKAKDDNVEERRSVIRYALKTGKVKTFDVVASLLCDKDVGKEASEALVEIGKSSAKDKVKAAVETLVKTLINGKDCQRRAAGRCLKEIGEPAVESLIWCMGSQDKTVRRYAQQILFHIPGSKDALLKALEHAAKPAISVGAEEVLRWLEGGKIPKAVLEDTEEARKAKAAAKAKAEADAKEATRKADLEAAVKRAEAAKKATKTAKSSGGQTALVAAISENSKAQKALLEEVKTTRAFVSVEMTELKALLAKAESLRQAPPFTSTSRATTSTMPAVTVPPRLNGSYRSCW